MNFIKNFENKVNSTIKSYEMIKKNDKILVAVSGGKDSTTLLYLLNKFRYNIEAGIIDLKIGKYTEINLKNIKEFCKKNNIKLNIFDLREEFGYSLCYIKSILKSKGINLASCSICGVLKRYILNKKARELKFTKLATGHNLDDEAETFLMNQFKGNIKLSAKLGPKPGAVKDKKFIQRIKPLYFIREKDIEKYSKLMNFPVNYEICPCATNVFRRNLINILDKYNLNLENLIKYFLKRIPELNKKYSNKLKMKYCKYCNEPSGKEVCNTCQIIEAVRQ